MYAGEKGYEDLRISFLDAPPVESYHAADMPLPLSPWRPYIKEVSNILYVWLVASPINESPF